MEEAYENTKKLDENPHVDILKVCKVSATLMTVFLTMEVFKCDYSFSLWIKIQRKTLKM